VQKEQKLNQPNTKPPKIIFSETPAVLVSIDGEPKLKPVGVAAYQQVINTPFQILFDPAAKLYYLNGNPQWFSASDLKGEWKVVDPVPEAIAKLAATPTLVQPGAPSTAPGKVKIIVVNEPSELIVSEGPPQWQDITETDLKYLKNSRSAVFFHPSTNTYYVMFSGRWFFSKLAPPSAPPPTPVGPGLWNNMVAALRPPPPPVAATPTVEGLKGPWTYLNPDQLPESFKKIPSNFAIPGILATIPGTDEAEDAVMDAMIPQTTVIDKKKAKFTPTYDGDPKFENISGTSIDYAVNTPDQILKDGDKYYAVDQGVWYVAEHPEGPWLVADQRPTNVDQIPPENPNYNTKYVYIYDTDEEYDTVTTGYTAGYLGSFILDTAWGTALSFGSGYYYEPWYGSFYYPRIWSYGYNAFYNPYYGNWAYRGPYGGAWYRSGYYSNNGYWGPGGYRNIETGDIHIGNVNREWDKNNLYDRKQNLDRNVSGDRLKQIENQRLSQLGERGPSAGRDPSTHAANHPNNVFADKDGNVFRRDSNGQWERNEGREWKTVDRSEGLGNQGGLRENQPRDSALSAGGLAGRKADTGSRRELMPAEFRQPRAPDREAGSDREDIPPGITGMDREHPSHLEGGLERERLSQREAGMDHMRPSHWQGGMDHERLPMAERPMAQRPSAGRDLNFDHSNMERQNRARDRGNQRANNYHNYQASQGRMDRGGGRASSFSGGGQRGGGVSRSSVSGGGGRGGGGRGGGGGGRRR
jgi:hypothetical protein